MAPVRRLPIQSAGSEVWLILSAGCHTIQVSQTRDLPCESARGCPTNQRSGPSASTDAPTWGDDHASQATAPLFVDAAVPRSRPDLTAALAGIGTVVEAVVVNDVGCCVLIDASASIGPDNVAGVDELGQRALDRRRRRLRLVKERGGDRAGATASTEEKPRRQRDPLRCRPVASAPRGATWMSRGSAGPPWRPAAGARGLVGAASRARGGSECAPSGLVMTDQRSSASTRAAHRLTPCSAAVRAARRTVA